MIKIEYICDCCHEASTSDERIWRVHLLVSRWSSSSLHSNGEGRVELWCQSCIESHGMLPWRVSPQNPPRQEPATLDSLVKDMIERRVGEESNDG